LVAIAIIATILWALSANREFQLLNISFVPIAVSHADGSEGFWKGKLVATLLNGEFSIKHLLVRPAGRYHSVGYSVPFKTSFNFLWVIVTTLCLTILLLPSAIRRVHSPKK
jgi:hypothetical protein